MKFVFSVQSFKLSAVLPALWRRLQFDAGLTYDAYFTALSILLGFILLACCLCYLNAVPIFPFSSPLLSLGSRVHSPISSAVLSFLVPPWRLTRYSFNLSQFICKHYASSHRLWPLHRLLPFRPPPSALLLPSAFILPLVQAYSTTTPTTGFFSFASLRFVQPPRFNASQFSRATSSPACWYSGRVLVSRGQASRTLSTCLRISEPLSAPALC